MKTPEEIFKENYFKPEDANEEDWTEAKKMGEGFHKCILDSISDFHNQFKNNKAVEISDKEIEEKALNPFRDTPNQSGFIEGAKWMRDKQGAAPNNRFQLPSDKQMIEIAILFNGGKLEQDKLADMVAYGQFIVDRLYENGNVSKPSLKEEENK